MPDSSENAAADVEGTDADVSDSATDHVSDSATDSASNAADSEASPTEAPQRRLRGKTLWLSAVAAGVIVVLAVLALLQVLSVRNHDDLQSRRQGAIDAASNEVVALLTVSDKTSHNDLNRLLAGATASFHDQLEQEAKSFLNALSQGKVSSTGSVAAAGLESLTGNTAKVAIAAKSTVKNSAAPNGEARNFRLEVTVQEVKGKWLVSGLTFVV